MTDLRSWRADSRLDLSQDKVNEIVRLCVRNSEYTFTAGGHGTDYADVDYVFASAEMKVVQEWITALGGLVRALVEEYGYDSLVFIHSNRGPSGALSARVPLAEAAELESYVLRPHKRLLAQAMKPFERLDERRALIVTDVATSGSSVIEGARILWRCGARNVGALAFFDRMEGAQEHLGMYDITLHRGLEPESIGSNGSLVAH